MIIPRANIESNGWMKMPKFLLNGQVKLMKIEKKKSKKSK